MDLNKKWVKDTKKDAKRWTCIYQLLAKMVGMTASDKKQVKNRMFLKMGDFDELDEGLWDNIRKKKEIKIGSGEKMRKKGEKRNPNSRPNKKRHFKKNVVQNV